MEEIRESIMKTDKVLDVHDLHVWTITSGMNALSGHIVVTDQILSEADKVVQAINRKLLENYGISHTTIQVEPERKVLFKRGSNDRKDKGIAED
jgi:cobalt-zinc-cadmium efflux system protein